MRVKDLLNRNKQKAQDITHTETLSEPVKKEAEEASFPKVSVSPYRQAVARACELARRLGLLVYEVESKGKIYIYEVLEDKDKLLMEIDPLCYRSLSEFEWHIRDSLGKILIKRRGGTS